MAPEGRQVSADMGEPPAFLLGDSSRFLSIFLFSRYGTQPSLSGPYLTSVLGKEVGDREFWQLLRDPDTPLQQGESGGLPPWIPPTPSSPTLR